MLAMLSLLSLILAAFCLIALAIIDLKTKLLPNVLVLSLAMLGYVYHLGQSFEILSPAQMINGAVIGGGFLLLIRTAGNHFYKQDTLGLGDVKLMSAAGLWLGPEYILIALISGALVGLVHGGAEYMLCSRNNKAESTIGTHGVAAGPGFIVGILIAAAMMGLAKILPLAHLALT